MSLPFMMCCVRSVPPLSFGVGSWGIFVLSGSLRFAVKLSPFAFCPGMGS